MKAPRKPRRYESVWLRIKSKPMVKFEIDLPESQHARFIKALRKERSISSLTWDMSDCFVLKCRPCGNKITVWLEQLSGATALQELHAYNLTHLLPSEQNTND